MKAVIQSIPARLEAAERQRKALGFPCDIYVDEEMKGPFVGFCESLRAYPSGDDYRLHMQDDLIYCEYFRDYIPEVQRLMRENDLSLLSLFAPRRKHMSVQYAKGKRIATFPKFLWMQCVVMSPRLVELLEFHRRDYDGKHDDVYVAWVLYMNRLKAHVHLPSLVQHDISIPSSMKHANNERRTSELFDKDFVASWKNSALK